MRVVSGRLHFLQIPLRLSVTHGARASRSSSDSIILALEGEEGRTGYGEAVVRDYVSGQLAGESGLPQEAAALVRRLVEPFRAGEIPWHAVQRSLQATVCRPQELPFLCAVETALLDLACAEAGADAYEVLGVRPLRERIVYGGVIPIVPIEQADTWLGRYMTFGFHEVKVKVGNDPTYNDAILGVCRRRLGAAFDMRVDANASWTAASTPTHLDVCVGHGVRVIEQPIPAGTPAAALREARARGVTFIADEGVLGEADVTALAAAGAYAVLNLRLSKNGGLSRVLALARAAESRGLRYQLGCMVGETAVLSALGRIAASLLPSPLYVEGSYDDIILSENVTEKGIGFGPGGEAGLIRGRGIGFTLVPEKLARLSMSSVAC
jgi:L-alanine-DL-glutamate epimerase-like enolase superfamily enzyme